MLKIGNKRISDRCDKADSVFKKAIGLMFKNKVKRPMIFYFDRKQKISVHMLFVFTALDLLFLDENKKIIEIKERLNPFKFYNPVKKANYLIELGPGDVERNKIKEGDKVEFD